MKFSHYWIDLSPGTTWCSQCGTLRLIDIAQVSTYLAPNAQRDPWENPASPVSDEPECEGERCPFHRSALLSVDPDGTSKVDPVSRCVLPRGHQGEHQP